MSELKWVPVVTATLPYPVSANAYWRTRIVFPKARGEKPFVQTYVSPEAKKFKESVGWLLRNAGVRQALQCRVRVDYQLRPNCPKDWKTRVRKDPLWWADTVQRIDVDNAAKVLLDAMKGFVFEDDAQVWKTVGEVLEPQEGVEACVVVRICRGVKEHPQGGLDL